jgi:excisionase family DNA binding protein
MSALATALLAELDDDTLDQLAALLAPRLATRSTPADDGWLRGAGRIAGYIDAPRSRVYALTSAKRIPCHRDGSNLLARKSELDAWLLSGGATRP